MSLTNEQKGSLIQRIQDYKSAGEPQNAQRLQVALDANKMPEDPKLMLAADELGGDDGVAIDLPPRAGRGSGIGKWKAAARILTAGEWEPEVIDDVVGRDDLIAML